jgi:hypothetical protein
MQDFYDILFIVILLGREYMNTNEINEQKSQIEKEYSERKNLYKDKVKNL